MWAFAKRGIACIFFYYDFPLAHGWRGFAGLDCYKFPAYCNKFPENQDCYTTPNHVTILIYLSRLLNMELNIPYHNTNIAVVSNYLLKSRYTLTVAEHRLLKSLIKQIPNYYDLKLEAIHSISVQDYADDWELPKDDARKELRKAGIALCSRDIYLPVEQSESFNITHWFSEVSYNRKTDILLSMFTSTVVANISELKERFTKLNLVEMKDFDSSYSFRLYEILLCTIGENSYKNPKFEVEVLMGMLDVPESLKDYRNFKARVLTPCTKELQNKTNKFSKLSLIEHKRKGSKKIMEVEFSGVGIGKKYKNL